MPRRVARVAPKRAHKSHKLRGRGQEEDNASWAAIMAKALAEQGGLPRQSPRGQQFIRKSAVSKVVNEIDKATGSSGPMSTRAHEIQRQILSNRVGRDNEKLFEELGELLHRSLN